MLQIENVDTHSSGGADIIIITELSLLQYKYKLHSHDLSTVGIESSVFEANFLFRYGNVFSEWW